MFVPAVAAFLEAPSPAKSRAKLPTPKTASTLLFAFSSNPLYLSISFATGDPIDLSASTNEGKADLIYYQQLPFSASSCC